MCATRDRVPPPGQCRRPVRRNFAGRPTPWSGVRGLRRIVRLADGSAGNQINLFPTRRRAIRVSAAPRGIRCGIAKRGCRDADEIAGSAEAGYLPVSFETIRVLPRRRSARQGIIAHLINLDGGLEKMGRIVTIMTPYIADRSGRHLSASCRTPCSTLPLKARRSSMPNGPARSQPCGSGASCRDDAEVGWYSPMRWMRQAKAQAVDDDFVQQWRSPMQRVHTADITTDGGAGHLQKRQAIQAYAGWRGGVRRRVPRVDWTTSWRQRLCDHHGGVSMRSSARGTADHRGYGWSRARTFRYRRRAGTPAAASLKGAER